MAIPYFGFIVHFFKVGLAPVASVSRMKSPIRIFTPFIHQFQVSGLELVILIIHYNLLIPTFIKKKLMIHIDIVLPK
jgi:hypothetical protein